MVSGFQRYQFIKPLQQALEGMDWANPTPIQEQAIPLAKSGKDILGIAQTGTGKTAAFLLPLMHKLHFAQQEGTRAIILVPTKELARQIFQHFEALNVFLGLNATLLVGGVGITSQLESLLSANDLVISTPGRFLEIYASGKWKLKAIKTLVIDEADRMMDMGFMPQIRKILELIPRKRQNMLFSATFPARVENLASEFLEFPERIEITPQSTPAASIQQAYFKTPNFQTKLNLLLHYLKELKENESALVFVKTKKNATEIGKFLTRKLSIPVSFLHANKGTNSRTHVVDLLINGEIKVLVATDIASRGLDIGSISLVINFDLPIQYEDYVHRIGRTGRANRKGKAVSFVSPPDELHLTRIEAVIKGKVDEQPLPKNTLAEETGYGEKQEILRKLDDQRKKADPDFKGAFHEKKRIKKGPKDLKAKRSGHEKSRNPAKPKPSLGNKGRPSKRRG